MPEYISNTSNGHVIVGLDAAAVQLVVRDQPGPVVVESSRLLDFRLADDGTVIVYALGIDETLAPEAELAFEVAIRVSVKVKITILGAGTLEADQRLKPYITCM